MSGRQGGIALLEVVLATALLSLTLIGAMQIPKRLWDLAQQDRLQLMVQLEERSQRDAEVIAKLQHKF